MCRRSCKTQLCKRISFTDFFHSKLSRGLRKHRHLSGWLHVAPTAPRELIHLLNCILEQEIRPLKNGGAATANDQLFDRSVFKSALPTVSNARLNQYLYAEYASERPFVSKLEGQKAEQTPDSLANLWSLSRDAAIAKAKEL